jgi:hypothetical protein
MEWKYTKGINADGHKTNDRITCICPICGDKQTWKYIEYKGIGHKELIGYPIKTLIKPCKHFNNINKRAVKMVNRIYSITHVT